ncbi:hypothetical protein ACPCG0_05775 [Propionibacteriaceae bacterium Y1923]|uniref:hypothetical protein n=1 Tax=Aestuariimicrobium sp. Y1814 TaxID=3418742 RepID=UPI003C1B4004
MMRPLRALLGLLVALAGLVPAGAAGAAAAPQPLPGQVAPERVVPATATDCVAGGGVWVIVILEDGRRVAQGCSTNPGDGRAALTAVASVIEREQGFVCQINNIPNRCTTSSEWTPTTPMWRYSHANPGGSWIYSNFGYAARTPPRGSLEGWCLSAGPCESTLASVLNPGTVRGYVPAPPTTQAPTTRPATTRPATTRPATQAPTSRPATTRPATTRAATTSATTTAPTTSAPATTPSPTASTAPSSAPASSSAAPSTSEQSPSETSATTTVSPTSPEATATPIVANQPSGGNGTPWGAITTGVLVAVAAGAFALVRVRRGRAGAADEFDLNES